jgi:hypothetical protein
MITKLKASECLAALYGQEQQQDLEVSASAADAAAIANITYFEDKTAIVVFQNLTELHIGQGLNPTGSLPLNPKGTYLYPNGSSGADNITMLWHQCYPDNSCKTAWNNGQIDQSRSSSEGPIKPLLPPTTTLPPQGLKSASIRITTGDLVR